MSIKIEKYFGENLKEGIKICQKHTLYIIGWEFQRYLSEFPNDIICIFILYKDGKPIGSLIHTNDLLYSPYNFGVYIRKYERRKGYGSMLTRFFRAHYSKAKLCVGQGAYGTCNFWDKNAIRHHIDWC